MAPACRWSIGLLTAALALGAGFYLWAKTEHYPNEAVDRAETFVTLVQAGQLEKARELALSNEYVGRTPEQFAALMPRQTCGDVHVQWTSPPQTNGNRLRRWWRGVEVDMPTVRVELEGVCLIAVELRRIEGQWKVFSMQRHAG